MGQPDCWIGMASLATRPISISFPREFYGLGVTVMSIKLVIGLLSLQGMDCIGGVTVLTSLWWW